MNGSVVPATGYLTLKEKMDIFFKLSEKIDRYWQMFIYTNFVASIALGSTLISRSTAGQIVVPFMGSIFPVAFIIQVFIWIFFSIFLFMNFGAIKDAYEGLDRIVTEIQADLAALAKAPAGLPRGLPDWINALNFSGRVKLAKWIFIYSFVAVTTVIAVFAKHMGQLP